MRKMNKDGTTYEYKNKCMDNDKLNKISGNTFGKDNEFTIMSCGCCTADMVGTNDAVKNDDKKYCVNGPAFCTPDDGDDAWYPCDTSGKGDVKTIHVCVTDLLSGNMDTFCVDPFDDIFSDPEKSVECGICDGDEPIKNPKGKKSKKSKKR